MKLNPKHIALIVIIIIGLIVTALALNSSRESKTPVIDKWNSDYIPAEQSPDNQLPKTEREIFLDKLVVAAIECTTYNVRYDPAYVKIKYPGGDVPADQGVCADVIIRAYRQVGIDLQKEVHEDMSKNFNLYPKIWGLTKPDTNIDHRRVLNLITFFKRKGKVLPITNNPDDFSPGDIVAWDLSKELPHIGIVINSKSTDNKRFKIVHNIGAGQKSEDVLFNWKIIGHFRYFGSKIDRGE